MWSNLLSVSLYVILSNNCINYTKIKKEQNKTDQTVKENLDKKYFKNFRPISQTYFICFPLIGVVEVLSSSVTVSLTPCRGAQIQKNNSLMLLRMAKETSLEV